MSINVKEIIESMEKRVTLSDSVGILIEMQLSKLAQTKTYANIKTFQSDIYEIDSRELVKSELRTFTYLILEFLMETSYQNLATMEDIADFLKQAIEEVRNPWGFEESFIERMARDLVRKVLMNEGKNFPLKDKPLNQPTHIGGTVDILTQKIKSLGGENSRTAYKLTDEAFQFLYRKKEVESYLQNNLTFATMMMYEAITKGNYEGVLQGVKELELVLGHFTFSEIPEFITKMNLQFDTIYEEKCKLADEGYVHLKLAMQEVQKIRQLVGESRQHLVEQELNGLVSTQSEKYHRNKKKLIELDTRITQLLHSFSYALTAIQQLNEEYDRLLDHYEVKTTYDYLDVKKELYPLLAEESFLNQAQLLRALMSEFEIPQPMKHYTLDRLINPRHVRKSQTKSESTTSTLEDDENFLNEEKQKQQQSEQQLKKRQDLILDILLFITRRGDCLLTDYLEELKTRETQLYLDYLTATDGDLFYLTILYDLYKKTLYIPRNQSPEEIKKTEEMDASLVEIFLTDSRFKPFAGRSFMVEIVEDSDEEPKRLHVGFPNFKMRLTDDEFLWD